MIPFVRFFSVASILACSVASCAGDEFSTGSGSTSTAGSATGNAGTEIGSAGAAGGGTAGLNGSGGTNGAGGASGSGGGVIGSGGVGGTGGHAGGNAGNSGTVVVDAGRDAASQCPATIPASGSSCTADGVSCTYGDCCPSYATCISGKWQIALPKCAAPTCPVMAPVNGTSCACFVGLSCQYDKCSLTQQMTDAKCGAGNVWSVQTYGCENACGAEDCVAGQICLIKGTAHCVTNPCLPNPLACACASGLCAPQGCSVSSVNSATMTCQ